MRISFVLFITILYAASDGHARGPGLVTLPEKCNCPVGSTCPVTDGCYIQGKKEAAAEADRRCSASVEAARAEEQAKCDAKVWQEKTSCDSKLSEAETRCNNKVSEEKSSCDAKISEAKTSCDNRISQAETSCISKISEKENSCNARISEEKSNCDARLRTDTAANGCGVAKWGQGWYVVKAGVNLANCQNLCKADPKCLSFSNNKSPNGNHACYLYDKETAQLTPGNYGNYAWVQFDKHCGPVPNYS
ncbi:hypothetical protein FPRO05_05083 [Fusarium proliferatum]|uniref:Apple domain-containing protein n=1 Tax=Gibberella intermedia TaxID=948311 RepID=A0A365MPJ1_GIBIN|nr:hypothetical protein FPRO05_05083 [Fusarium proliferatum]